MAPSFTMFDAPPVPKSKPKHAHTPATIHNTKTTIVIISKGGSLSECVVEPSAKITLEELTVLLSKKCGNRNHEGFSCYCLLYTSPSPRDRTRSRMPSSA